MAAAAAYSWGVSTADDADVIPDVNNVYQWYGEINDDGNMDITIYHREYTGAGPVFAESKFTVEAAIRRCFDVAARMSVEKLVAKYDERVKQLIDRRIMEGTGIQKTYFKQLFAALDFDGTQHKQGLALVEPFVNDQAVPAVHMEGCTFTEQGSTAAKRIRLIAKDDGDFLVPVRVAVGEQRVTVSTAAQGLLASKLSPYGDVRLLAGSMVTGSREVFKLLQFFVNHCIKNVGYGGDQLVFPTVLPAEAIEFICNQANVTASDCGALLPVIGDDLEKQIGDAIKQYIPNQPAITNLTRFITDNMDNNNEREVALAKIQNLMMDPVLWINGPCLMNEINGMPQSITIRGRSQTRTQLLAGFREQSLKKYTDRDILFTTERDDVEASVNTICNILDTTTNCAVRKSQWENAYQSSEPIFANIADQDDADAPILTSSSAYGVLEGRPLSEARFRLSAMEYNVRDRLVGSLDAEEIDFDAAFKQFEYDMHVGDKQAYINEVLTVIRLALECILIEAPAVGTIKPIKLVDFYGDVPLERAFLPVLDEDATIDRIDVSVSDAPLFGGEVSAASHFVHQHIVDGATVPFNRRSFQSPSYKEVTALLASLNPFPLTNEGVKIFIKSVLEGCRQRMKTVFGNSIHMVQQMEHTRPSEIHQPFPPELVKFNKTCKNKTLHWSVGAESTWMLEGMVLALNLLNCLPEREEEEDEVEKKESYFTDPIYLNVGDDISTKRRALQASSSNHFKTGRFRIGNYVYDANAYWKTLNMNDDAFLQAGRLFLGNRTEKKDRPETFVGIFETDSEVTLPKQDVELNEYFAELSDKFETWALLEDNPEYKGIPIGQNGKCNAILFCQKATYNDRAFKSKGKSFLHVYQEDFLEKQADLYKIKGDENSLLSLKFEEGFLQNLQFTISKEGEDIMNRTLQFEVEDEETPYEFSKSTKTGIKAQDVVDTLMKGFEGLHFSNTRSLRRTVMATATGQKCADIERWLKQTISSGGKEIKWAVNVADRRDGDAALLGMLYMAFEGSTTRATDMPMSERVLVRCKGPGAADEPTPCYVEGYYYRTSMFFQMEVKAMQIFAEVMSRHRCMPPDAVRDPLGKHVKNGTIKSLHDLLQRKKTAAPAVCKMMVNLYEFEKVGQRSRGSRDKAALKIQSDTIATDAHHILFRI